MTFFLDYFFYSKFLLIYLLQFFFRKCSRNFFTIKMINDICPWNCIFNFFNHKNVFRQIWSIACSKNVFVFRYSHMITNFKFRILLLTSLPKLIYVLSSTSIGFILVVLCFVLLYSCCIHLLYHLICQSTHFLILKSCACRSCALLS